MFAEDDISFEIRKLHQLIKREFDKMQCKNTLPTRLQSAVIVFVLNNTKKGIATYQKDIEKEFSIRGSTATTLIKNMEKSGLLLREASSRDGRLKTLVVTQKSRDLLHATKEKAALVKAKITRGLTEQDISNFVEFLHKIQNNLEDNNVKNTI